MSRTDLDQQIPFIEYLKKQKLNSTLCHLIVNSIAMVDYTATTKEVLLKIFPHSLRESLIEGFYQSEALFSIDGTLRQFTISLSIVR